MIMLHPCSPLCGEDSKLVEYMNWSYLYMSTYLRKAGAAHIAFAMNWLLVTNIIQENCLAGLILAPY